MQGEILDVILKLSLLAFVVSSVLAMGLSLTVPQIVEPLRSVRPGPPKPWARHLISPR